MLPWDGLLCRHTPFRSMSGRHILGIPQRRALCGSEYAAYSARDLLMIAVPPVAPVFVGMSRCTVYDSVCGRGKSIRPPYCDSRSFVSLHPCITRRQIVVVSPLRVKPSSRSSVYYVKASLLCRIHTKRTLYAHRSGILDKMLAHFYPGRSFRCTPKLKCLVIMLSHFRPTTHYQNL